MLKASGGGRNARFCSKPNAFPSLSAYMGCLPRAACSELRYPRACACSWEGRPGSFKLRWEALECVHIVPAIGDPGCTVTSDGCRFGGCKKLRASQAGKSTSELSCLVGVGSKS